MPRADLVIFCIAAIAVYATSAQFGQQTPLRPSPYDISGRNTAPDTILACYRNITAYNRFTRQPMHIENLISIIRKIEEKTYNQWDMRKIVRAILHRFDFPGLRYNPNGKDDFQFERKSEETAKTNIILSMIPGEDAIPEGILDNDDKCALHWMLSHSMNATMRDEEYSYNSGYNRRQKRWVWSGESQEGHSGSGSAEENAAESKSDETKETKVSNEESQAKQSAEKQTPEESVENKPEVVQPKEDAKSTKDETSGESKQKSNEAIKSSDESSLFSSSESKQKSNEAIKSSDESSLFSSSESKESKVESIVPNSGDADTIPAAVKSEEKIPDKSSEEHHSEEKDAKPQAKESEEKTAPLSEEMKAPEYSAESGEHAIPEQDDEKPQVKASEEKTAPRSEEMKSPEKSSESEELPVPEKQVSQEDHQSESSEEKHTPDTKQDIPTNDVAPPPQSPPQSRILNIPSDADSSEQEDDVEIFDESQSGASKVARQSVSPTTKTPVETGVIYTRWGSISAARLLAGIAAGLEPVTMTVGGYNTNYSPPGGTFGTGNFPEGNPVNPNQGYYNNNGRQPSKGFGRRKKRQVGSISFTPLENLYAGTLAGDIGQAAILNAKNNIPNYPIPKGSFNSSICPREYILEQLPSSNLDVFNPSHSWTFMTEAEVRGSVDGLILGNKIRDWNIGNEMRLSQLLEMYYSEKGVSNDPTYRSCDRQGLFNQIDSAKLKQQARSFAWIYNNRTSKHDYTQFEANPTSFERLIDEAYGKAISAVANFQMDDKCERRVGSVGGSETDDNLKDIDPKTTIYAVIDQTTTRDGILQQQHFLGQLVAELDIKPRGSRLGLVDGNSGQMIISPNYTDNAGVLPCTILSKELNTRGSDNKNQVLTSIQTELQKLRNIEENNEFNIGQGNGATVLFFVQGKLEENQRMDIRRTTQELSDQFGDLHVMYTSNVIQQTEVEEYSLDAAYDFIRLQGGDLVAPNVAKEFLKEYNKRNHARLYYPRCNARHFDQNDEHKQAVDFFMYPNTIQYYKISPDYFYSAKNLRLRFTSDNGKARVCWARNEKFPNSKNTGQNGVECKETSGSYVTPGSSNVDIDFGFKNPCGKNGKRGGCTPIYVSVTPTTTSAVGSGGLNCNIEGCEASNQVKITFTHWDMRCNSGIRAMISSPVALLTVLTSILAWFKST